VLGEKGELCGRRSSPERLVAGRETAKAPNRGEVTLGILEAACEAQPAGGWAVIEEFAIQGAATLLLAESLRVLERQI
jgi:hypothetical protein